MKFAVETSYLYLLSFLSVSLRRSTVAWGFSPVHLCGQLFLVNIFSQGLTELLAEQKPAADSAGSIADLSGGIVNYQPCQSLTEDLDKITFPHVGITGSSVHPHFAQNVS